MDTRTKILNAERAQALLRERACKVVFGYFDVLLAEHIHTLDAVKDERPLMAVVADPAHPVLPAPARAELAAALAAIDHVVACPPEALDCGRNDVVDLRPDHDLRWRGLLEHVHRRQG